MKQLSFTQEYLLCALSPKGTLPMLRQTEILTCLVTGGLLELLYSGTISIDAKNKVLVEKELERNQFHLEPLYDTLKGSKPMKVYDLAAKYVFSSHKLPDHYLQALCLPMAEQQGVFPKTGGLFHNRPVYVPNQEEVEKIVEKLRAVFLEDGTVDDDTLVLGALLQKSGLIKNYFSKFESDSLNRRIQEIKESEAGSLIKKMIDYVDTLIAVMASVGSSAGS
ncbi:GOLPH3/VPS74 family protein [Faecalispora anaeroviscerum]|uniref:GOLPH3/VPS74 family protein n=1 Tax=Faecalispora anaeroviscerum TaxID=2991836 RepID=UPI0024B8DA11|nr:GPP34 family phosphoprotein [Faecalispora anaeroviscerum]